LNKLYQAIVMTEVIEHLHHPNSILKSLWQLLEPGGVLAIMTQRVISPEKFKTWQYKNDPTHVCFYSNKAFEWLAKELDAKLVEFVGRDMVLLTKGTL
jgi:2-polyprenyl-3-methyl-5-hydroxy-6-metoxy-1,4-benzoquinol methylase